MGSLDNKRQTSKLIACGAFVYSILNLLIGYILAFLLASMTVAICYQVVSRYVFDAPSMLTQEFLRYSLIWLGLLAGAYCFMLSRHLNLPFWVDKLSSKNAARLNVFNITLTSLFGLMFVIGGYHSYVDNLLMTTAMFKVSVGILQLAMLVSGLIIIVAQIYQLHRLFNEALVTVGDLLGAVLLLLGLAALIWWVAQTSLFAYLVDSHLELFSLLVLFGVFFVFLIIGSPIAIGLAYAGLFTLALQVDFITIFPTASQTIFNGLDSFGFLALPFFILAGNIMNQTGLARRLIDLAMLIGRHIPGSLWHSNIVANMLFGTLSGSGIASASAIGGIITPVAREKGYDMPMTTAVNAASAPCGMLIPPSGALIVYSLITGGSASIIALFIAGYLPGLIMGLAVMIGAYLFARRHGYKAETGSSSFAEIAAIFLRAAPSLLLVIIVIGGILGGAFTAIEGSGVAVLYSLLLAIIYRALSLKKLFGIFLDTAVVSGIILFLIACSGMMSWTMTFASIPDTVGTLLTGFSDNKYILLLLIVFVLLVVGVFMDMSPAMLIFTPIFFPVVINLGVDPVHFGIILVYTLSMGLVTPPVGTVLFVSCSISGEKITRVLGPLMPIFFMQFLGLLLVTFVPAVSLALPRLFGL
jgi:tripartite ATP-independent transporter DctM subunit